MAPSNDQRGIPPGTVGAVGIATVDIQFDSISDKATVERVTTDRLSAAEPGFARRGAGARVHYREYYPAVPPSTSTKRMNAVRRRRTAHGIAMVALPNRSSSGGGPISSHRTSKSSWRAVTRNASTSPRNTWTSVLGQQQCLYGCINLSTESRTVLPQRGSTVTRLSQLSYADSDALGRAVDWDTWVDVGATATGPANRPTPVRHHD